MAILRQSALETNLGNVTIKNKVSKSNEKTFHSVLHKLTRPYLDFKDIVLLSSLQMDTMDSNSNLSRDTLSHCIISEEG